LQQTCDNYIDELLRGSNESYISFIWIVSIEFSLFILCLLSFWSEWKISYILQCENPNKVENTTNIHTQCLNFMKEISTFLRFFFLFLILTSVSRIYLLPVGDRRWNFHEKNITKRGREKRINDDGKRMKFSSFNFIEWFF
jgi:hypothetical protein